jgi:hypothetical protein
MQRFAHNYTGVQNVTYLDEFMVSKKRGPIIPVAFIAQHTSKLMPCNGILWIGTGNSIL